MGLEYIVALQELQRRRTLRHSNRSLPRRGYLFVAPGFTRGNGIRMIHTDRGNPVYKSRCVIDTNENTKVTFTYVVQQGYATPQIRAGV